MIERGRHLFIDRNFRLCQICEKQNIYIIEDEFHLFIQCIIDEQMRKKNFKKQLSVISNDEISHTILEEKKNIYI